MPNPPGRAWSLASFTGFSLTSPGTNLSGRVNPDLLDVDVLKASHHGSINGVDGSVDGLDWLDFVSPEAVVISAHINSQHGHPDPKAVELYEAAVGHNRVYCTSRHGTIRVYGRADGTFSIFKQVPSDSSCAFGAP